jgi:hypothetical protein
MNYFSLDAERNSYIWAKDIFAGQPGADWNIPYQQVFYANLVLDGLKNIPADSAAILRGEALFHRAFAFYNLAQEFAAPYHAATAGTDLGIPLRLDPDVSKNVARSTLLATYKQILTDLVLARGLLPEKVNYKSRPGKASAYGLLSRVYLAMEDYSNAGACADSCIMLSDLLIDYNTLSPAARRPFPRALPNGNNEVVFYSAAIPYSYSDSDSPTLIDSNLYASYAANDLRRTLFFKAFTPGTYIFRGNYAATLVWFTGLATDEMYLISAECSARAGKTQTALDKLNILLANRTVAGTFKPLALAKAEDVLRLVLAERRKELIGRGLRWADLRRLNNDDRFKIALSRTLNGVNYILEPGSPRYVYPIPDDEIRLEGLVQNQR